MPFGAAAAASVAGGVIGALGAKSAAGQQSQAAIEAARLQAGASTEGARLVSTASTDAAKIYSTAALEAAKLQTGASTHAADLQLGMFNTIRGDLSGYRDVGASALPGFYALMGMSPPPVQHTTQTQAPTVGAGAPVTAVSQQTLAPSFTTPQQPQQQQVSPTDWGNYLQTFPDVAQYYAANAHELQKAGFPTAESFAAWHFQNHGQGEMASGQRQQWPPPVEQQQPQQTAAPQVDTTAPTQQEQTQQPQQEQPQMQAPAFDSAAMQKFLESTPGYQFTRDQGMQAVTNQLTAKGLGGVSGAYGKGLARFVTGLADQTYGGAVDRYRQAVTMGQSAAAQTGTFGQAATTAAGNALIGGANAAAGGITGAAGAAGAGITGAAQAGAAGLTGAASAGAGGLIGAANAGAAGTIGATGAIGAGISGAANALLTPKILGMYANPNAGLY